MPARRTVFFSLIATSLIVTACSEDPLPDNQRIEQVAKVVVEPVQLSSERTRVEAVGTSRARQSVTLYPVSSGEVVAVNFEPGEYMEKDAVLVELDQRDEKLAVELAQLRLADAERLYQRYQRSAASGATLPTTLDAAKTELEATRIELGRASVALEDRTVRAPFSGYAGITDIDPGDRVQQTTAITTLDNRESLLVSFDVPELLVGRIQVGDRIAIATWNANTTAAEGEVIDLDSRIDPETRTFVARARVDNADDRLRPGMSFRVNLDLAGDTYPVLPEVSLQWGAEGSFVWSVVDGKARRIPVNIVQRQQGKVLVEADLQPSDQIVVEGIQRLRPGLGVSIQPTAIADDSAPVAEPAGAGPG